MSTNKQTDPRRAELAERLERLERKLDDKPCCESLDTTPITDTIRYLRSPASPPEPPASPPPAPVTPEWMVKAACEISSKLDLGRAADVFAASQIAAIIAPHAPAATPDERVERLREALECIADSRGYMNRDEMIEYAQAALAESRKV